MRVIEYATVLQQAQSDGLRCVYPKSGAFAPVSASRIVGWIGPDDFTIRPDLTARIVRCPAPYAENLARHFIDAWQRDFSTPAWALPKSHWAYELDHAHQDWLLEILTDFGIDTAALASKTDAAAIEFGRDETATLHRFLISLLTRLKTSDYAILLPGQPAAITVHHHQQLWWQTTDAALVDRLAIEFPKTAK